MLEPLFKRLYGLRRLTDKPSFDGIEGLLAKLGQPQTAFPIVQIAGTNGKGSTAATLASILTAAGYRVGLFTSPHLVEYRERFQIQGHAVSNDLLAPALDGLLRLADDLRPPALFFDITTALGVLLFQQASVEIGIFEAGMGGRYDQTTALPAILTLLTSVGYDHCEVLGDTLEAIAAEKAGILRPAIPALLGEIDPAPLAVIQKAASACGASPLFLAGREFSLTPASEQKVGPLQGPATWNFSWGQLQYQGLRSSLTAAYQRSNLALAISASLVLRDLGFVISEAAIREGLQTTRWPGRLERFFFQQRHVWLDGAHNPSGASALLASLPTDRTIRLVFGCMQDKDIPAILGPLASCAASLHLTALENPRTASLSRLDAIAASLPHPPPRTIHTSVEEALYTAIQASSPDDLLLVSGSLGLVGEVLPLLGAEAKKPPS